jgi:chromosome segregation ATPase
MNGRKMTVAHEPSMDDILKSIRRIIRNDQDEAVSSKKSIHSNKIEKEEELELKEEELELDDNLIKMEIQDQKRVRILEKKLQTLELEYEQKLTLHRRKMSEYRHQNKELTVAFEDCRSKLKTVTSSLKSAHDCLEKLDSDNKNLADKLLRLKQEEHGSVVLKAIQKEFVNLYHPERAKGDQLSKVVRQEVYNEFNEVLQGVWSRFQHNSA